MLAAAGGAWAVAASGIAPVAIAAGCLMAMAALALLAMRDMPGGPPHLSGQGRTLVDGLIVPGSVLLIAWIAGLAAVYAGHAGPASQESLLGVLADLAAAAAALVIFTRARPAARARFALLAGGFGALALGDSARAWAELAGSPPWLPVALPLWLAGWALVGWGALLPPAPGLGDGLKPGLPTRLSVLIPSTPFAAALLAAGWGVTHGGLTGFEIWTGAIVMVLIVARQILALLENISFWRELEDKVEMRSDQLERSEARFRSLVQNSSDIIAVVGEDGVIRYVSPSITAVLGYEPAAFGDEPPLDAVHPDDLEKVAAAMGELGTRPGGTATMEMRARHADGSWRYVEAVATNLLADDAVRGLVLNVRDVTERKALQEREAIEVALTHRAFHDPLTGIANRALFADRLDHALGRSIRHGHPTAVLFLDLDAFKDVNDSLGHAAGDELLAAVAHRLDEVVRPADTVARLGGDEFAVLVEEFVDVVDVARVAERILGVLGAPIRVGAREVFVGGSIGIATSSPGVSGEDLLRNADMAMYTAKARGKGGFALFEPGMQATVAERVELENALRGALERTEFELDYQPIVKLDTGEVRAVEALVRWRRPGHGRVPPAHFIHLAEKTGLIVPLGRWILDEACEQGRRWGERFGPAAGGLGVNVNVSPLQLRDGALASDVAAALEQSGLEPERLMLEITEGRLVDEGGETVARLEQLRALGVGLSIDDFGTGYSSLSYLGSLPVDQLKIAKSFVDGLTPGSQQAALTETIVAMSRSLGVSAVAEGVEGAIEAAELRRMGCELAQGFHFARPASAEAVEPLLAAAGNGSSATARSPLTNC